MSDNNKKYALTNNTIKSENGDVLYQIKALRDFGEIKKDALGGYIAAENNLSHDDLCWVSGNAQVYGYAKVCGNARIYDDTQVYGYAWIGDNARVSGNAHVSDYAWIGDKAWIGGDARVSGNAHVSDYAWIGDKAWIGGDAQVYGNARVYGNAVVCDNAQVYGNAWVYGNARVCDNARVYATAVVRDNARVYGDAWIYMGYIKYSLQDQKYSLYAQLGVMPINNKVILYKRVNKIEDGVYCSLFDKTFFYYDNKTAEAEIFDKSDESCTSGIHLALASYWDEGDTLIACEVDLDDIITVQQAKVRCRKAVVIGEVDLFTKEQDDE